MDEYTLTYLESLQQEVSALPDDRARACLTNFIKICDTLYSIEEVHEKESQDILDECRRTIFDVHTKSVRLLGKLLRSKAPKSQRCMDSVLRKMKELISIGEKLDQQGNQKLVGTLIFSITSEQNNDFTITRGDLAHSQRASQYLVERLSATEDSFEWSSCSEDIIGGSKAGSRIEEQISAVNYIAKRYCGVRDYLIKSNARVDADQPLSAHTGIIQNPSQRESILSMICAEDIASEISTVKNSVVENTFENNPEAVIKSSNIGNNFADMIFEGSVNDTSRSPVASVQDTQEESCLKESTEPEVFIREIVQRLNYLSSRNRKLEKVEKKSCTQNRKLMQRLECLKKEVESHPAIEIYTARNCRSPFSVKARQKEYVLYARSLEQILKKIRKAMDVFQAANETDLEKLEENVSKLRTISQGLASLHETVRDATGCPDGGESPCDSTSSENRHFCWKDLHKQGAEPWGPENLTRALAVIGSIRRAVDASLSHVEAHLVDSPDRRTMLRVKDGAGISSAAAVASCSVAAATPRWQPTLEVDQLDVDTFSFLPEGEEESRTHLIGGAKILKSTVVEFLRAVKARLGVIETQNVLDKALCRPFAETLNLQLDLVDIQSTSRMVTNPANFKPRAKSKSPPKIISVSTNKKIPETKIPGRRKSKGR